MGQLANLVNRVPAGARPYVLAGGAGLAAIVVIRGRKAPAPDPDTEAGTDPVDGTTGAGLPASFSNDVLGVDQLMAFESNLSDGIAALAENVDILINRPQGTSNPPPQTPSVLNPTQARAAGVLGKRQDTVRTRPGQNRGETFAELAQRLFGSRSYAPELVYMNASVWTALPKTSRDYNHGLPLGSRIVY